jgi:hypothetical protein
MTVRGTSHAAARSIRAVSPNQRARIFVHVLSKRDLGSTLEEIVIELGIAISSASPRRLELERAGWLEASGKRRLTTSGRGAMVWVVPEEIAKRARAKLADKGIIV